MLVGALPYVAMVLSNVHPGYYWSIPSAWRAPGVPTPNPAHR